MAEKKAIVCMIEGVDLSASSPALDALKKKAVLLPNTDCAGLKDIVIALGGVATDIAGLAASCEGEAALVLLQGDESALAAALEAADRRTLLVVVGKKSAALHGLAINAKADAVERAVNAQDLAVTAATIVDAPIDATCTGGIIYQAMKNPNLKLDEIKKLKEALVRMESVIQRDNREPWEKHDCA